MWEVRAAVEIARLWRTQGRSREAHALLEPVYSWFTEAFADRGLAGGKSLARRAGSNDSRLAKYDTVQCRHQPKTEEFGLATFRR